MAVIKNVMDQWIQEWQGKIQSKPLRSSYVTYKCSYGQEKYLNLSKEVRLPICRLETNNNKAPIVVGGYSNIPRSNRKCHICDLNVLGDEYHVVLECNNVQLVRQRRKFMQLYYRNRSSMYKFISLMSNTQELSCTQLRKYMKYALKCTHIGNLVDNTLN